MNSPISGATRTESFGSWLVSAAVSTAISTLENRGNLRTLALPLRIILEAVPDRPDLTVRLQVDDDVLTIVSTATAVDVRHGDTSPSPDVVFQTGYEAFLDVGEGLIPPEDFLANHVEVLEGAEKAAAFFGMLGVAISLQG